MDIRSSGQFQRVFTWRWRSPENQTVFELDCAELERIWSQDHDQLRDELDADTDLARPRPQLDLPYPGLDRKPGERGGRVNREPPQEELLARCAPPNPTRLEMDTGFEDSTLAALASRLHWAFKHRGRPDGLSPKDYAAQRELTVARSLTWNFFENCREVPGVPVVWRERFGDAAAVLGILLWARRLGRSGFTLSGPQGKTVLDIGIATWWRWLQTLERSGYLIRLRRWKPGKGGRPVALTANWYGFGPRALDELKALEDPRPTMKRARMRVRRQARRAEGRRRGVDLLPGYSFPRLEEYVGQVVESWRAAEARDAQRWAEFQAGTVPTDFTTAARPSFIFEMGDELDQLRRLEVLGGPGVVAEVGADVVDVVDGQAAEIVELAAGEADILEVAAGARFTGELDGPVGDRLDATGECASYGRAVRKIGGLVIGGHEQRHSKLEPGVTGRTTRRRVRHRGLVAPQPQSIGGAAFAARCATSHPGAVGAVSKRDSRDRLPAIPISPGYGSPGEGKMNLRTGPQASETRPPEPRRIQEIRPAEARGPLEAISAQKTEQSEAVDPRELDDAALLAQYPYLASMPRAVRADWIARLRQ